MSTKNSLREQKIRKSMNFVHNLATLATSYIIVAFFLSDVRCHAYFTPIRYVRSRFAIVMGDYQALGNRYRYHFQEYRYRLLARYRSILGHLPGLAHHYFATENQSRVQTFVTTDRTKTRIRTAELRKEE